MPKETNPNVPIIDGKKVVHRAIYITEESVQEIEDKLNDDWQLVTTPHRDMAILVKKV